MTLGEFFNECSAHPSNLLLFFALLPIAALLALVFGKNEGHLSPWKELYSVLVYLACIPGIFAVTLSIYMFFFERGSIMNANLFTQILPILTMMVTLWLIRRNVDFDQVPGFDKIGSLIFFLTILIILLWVLEKTNIYVFTYMPFYQFGLLFAGLVILLRFGVKRIFG
jgi:hypothetical protein